MLTLKTLKIKNQDRIDSDRFYLSNFFFKKRQYKHRCPNSIKLGGEGDLTSFSYLMFPVNTILCCYQLWKETNQTKRRYCYFYTLGLIKVQRTILVCKACGMVLHSHPVHSSSGRGSSWSHSTAGTQKGVRCYSNIPQSEWHMISWINTLQSNIICQFNRQGQANA